MPAACHSIRQAMAASRFEKHRLLPDEYAPRATWSLWQGGCCANFLHARTHLPTSTQLVLLHPKCQHFGGVTRKRLHTSQLAASLVPIMDDLQLRFHHAAELMWSERVYRCPGLVRGVLVPPFSVLGGTPDYKRKDFTSHPFISLSEIWNRNPKETFKLSRWRPSDMLT